MKLAVRTHLLLPALFLLFSDFVHAGSAKWNLNPTSDNWNRAANWTPATVPNGPNDVSTFGVSNSHEVNLSEPSGGLAEVNSIIFTPNASAFSFSLGLGYAGEDAVLSGSGIINYSGRLQTIFIYPNDDPSSETNDLIVRNSASAGNTVRFEVLGEDYDPEKYGGWLEFDDSATAGTAVIYNHANISKWGGTRFYDSSSADHAKIYNGGGSYSGGLLYFYDDSGAGDATIINRGTAVSGGAGGETDFWGGTAANSTITCMPSFVPDPAYVAKVYFVYDSDGGTSRIILNGDGTLDTSFHNAGTVTVGSIEGDGHVAIAQSNPITLAIGSNNLNTTFSGVLEPFDPSYANNASVSKVGTGRLILTNANTYAGGTIVEAGTLLVNNTIGSGTGSGNVFVTGGTFGGTGTVAGRVTVGTGIGAGAFLAPGTSGVNPGTLTIQKKLILEADSTYKVTVDSRIPAADKVTALAPSLRQGLILFNDISASVIPVGTIFTIVENTAAEAIVGTFSNLPDGGAIQIGLNTYQANYEGGDGNDLTLTVVQ